MAGSWRLAKSLETLRGQVNEAYPNRSKVSDGTIGDVSHSATWSDHNPNSEGVVTALDLTHDPANGFDAHEFADHLAENPHPQLKYIISESRIAGDFSGWNWGWYAGINPHESHIHISVGEGPDGQSLPGTYDSTDRWNIKEDAMSEDGVRLAIRAVTRQDVPFGDKERYEKEVKYWIGRSDVEFGKYLLGIGDQYGKSIGKDAARNLAKRIGLLAHMPEAEINGGWMNDNGDRIFRDPNQAAAISEALYKGKRWQQYNDRGYNFDKYQKEAFEKGKAEAGAGEYEKVTEELYRRK